jgi:thiamine-monophosphate kinase
MNEFDLIDTLIKPLTRGAKEALGLEDDACFVPKAKAGYDMLSCMDTLLAGIHFLESDPPETIGRKALRVNLSDLAAMGAQPRGALLSLGIPDSINDTWLTQFFDGLGRDLETFGLALLGGDTVRSPGGVMVTFTVFGEVPEGKIMMRKGARPNDLICVTGSIGDGALGLLANTRQLDMQRSSYNRNLIDRYRVPKPRVPFGVEVREVAHCCMDISDGLLADLGHICRAGGVSAKIAIDSVPISRMAENAILRDPTMMEMILTGGDDYELLFTIHEDQWDTVQDMAHRASCAVSVIGRIFAPTEAKETVQALNSDGEPVKFKTSGYMHRS